MTVLKTLQSSFTFQQTKWSNNNNSSLFYFHTNISSGLNVSSVSGENNGDLESTTEGLVEEETGLERGDEREPRE